MLPLLAPLLLLTRERGEEMPLGGERLKQPRNKFSKQEGACAREQPLMPSCPAALQAPHHAGAVLRAGLQRKHPKLTFKFIFPVLKPIFQYQNFSHGQSGVTPSLSQTCKPGRSAGDNFSHSHSQAGPRLMFAQMSPATAFTNISNIFHSSR